MLNVFNIIMQYFSEEVIKNAISCLNIALYIFIDFLNDVQNQK